MSVIATMLLLAQAAPHNVQLPCGGDDPAAIAACAAMDEAAARQEIANDPAFANVNLIGDKWIDCAYANLAKVLPNDFDPVEAIASAAVDMCREAEQYRHGAAMFYRRRGMAPAEIDMAAERQRRTLVRLVSAEIVMARSDAAKRHRRLPVPDR